MIIASAVMEAEGTSLVVETAVDVLMHPIEEVGPRQASRAVAALRNRATLLRPPLAGAAVSGDAPSKGSCTCAQSFRPTFD